MKVQEAKEMSWTEREMLEKQIRFHIRQSNAGVTRSQIKEFEPSRRA